MTSSVISRFARPAPNIPIRKGAPQISRPTKEEVEAFPAEAQALLERNQATQRQFLAQGRYDLSWLEGRHVLLAGATGQGLGCAFAAAIFETAHVASLTIVSRDLSRSLGYETGKVMQHIADAQAWGHRFHWLNDGMALEGKPLQKILAALKEAGADNVVYFNTVAAAISGLLPGMPPVYIKDVDEEGLFQWEMQPLTDKEITITRLVMGEMAAAFPKVLEDNGVKVDVTAFADWRGSLDRAGRNPDLPEYGRHGAYSTSLYLPKDIIQDAARDAYGTDRLVIDMFYPTMRTRALSLIPGGVVMAAINEKLMEIEGIPHIDIPELALMGLDRAGKALLEGYDNPFPRFDRHDCHLDDWQYEIMAHLTNDEDSKFYYKHWINL